MKGTLKQTNISIYKSDIHIQNITSPKCWIFFFIGLITVSSINTINTNPCMDIKRITLKHSNRYPESSHIKFRYKNTEFEMAGHKHDHISNIIHHRGYYGPVEVIYNLKQKYKEKDIFVLDIGANIGVVSLYAANLGFNVISIEAAGINVERLKESIFLNKLQNIQVYQFAAHSKEECLRLTINWLKEPTGLGNYGSNSFANVKTHKRMKFKDIPAPEYEYVLANRLDKLFDNNINNITLMKVDIEGWECHGFEGARNLFVLKKVKNIFVEVNYEMLRAAGCSGIQLKLLLRSLCVKVEKFPIQGNGNPDFFGEIDENCQVYEEPYFTS